MDNYGLYYMWHLHHLIMGHKQKILWRVFSNLIYFVLRCRKCSFQTYLMPCLVWHSLFCSHVARELIIVWFRIYVSRANRLHNCNFYAMLDHDNLKHSTQMRYKRKVEIQNSQPQILKKGAAGEGSERPQSGPFFSQLINLGLPWKSVYGQLPSQPLFPLPPQNIQLWYF